MTYRSPELVGLFAPPKNKLGSPTPCHAKSQRAEPPRRQERKGEGEKTENLGSLRLRILCAFAFLAPSHSLHLRIPCAFAFFAPSHSLRLCIPCAFAFLAPLHSLRLWVRFVLSGPADAQAEPAQLPLRRLQMSIGDKATLFKNTLGPKVLQNPRPRFIEMIHSGDYSRVKCRMRQA
jgi:hypothetical protein